MKTVRFLAILLSGACLWAGYQFTYSDGLTSIDPSKWAQTGSLSIGSSGVTGSGSLISTVAVPTGNDYDVRMTVHTANQGPCTGSYSLYARSTPSNTTSYVLTVKAGSVVLFKEVANSWTALSWLPYSCSDGTVMRLVVRSGNITFWSGPNTATYQDPSPIAAGQPGVGVSSSSGDTIGSVQIGPIDYLPPSAINASAVETSTAANRVDLRWPASAADADSAGLQGYVVYRDGVYLGSPLTPNWLDQTVTGGETTTYSIYVADQHGSLSAPALVSVSVPEGLGTTAAKPDAEARLGRPTAKNIPAGPSADQREVGVRPTGSYWGAAGENIDLLSGNLNFSIPLIKAMGRGNSSVTFALSYNSQMWRQSNGTVWLLGEDVGLGLGWKLQAGSILPLWYNGTQFYYQYTDATGAQYVLDQQNGSVWSSLQGIYVWFDANADVLHFPDGSFWNMTVVSASVEQDAGTLYPSQMEDSNGNFISLTYGAQAGCDDCMPNQSSRITTINDARGPGNGAGLGNTYYLEWWGTGIPHLVWISNGVGTSESYSFSTTTQTLLDPFNSTNFGSPTILQSVTVGGLNVEHQFQYDTSAELTQVTTPLGGVLKWTYAKYSYTARNYMGVWKRSMNTGANGFSNTVYIGSDSNPNWHLLGLVTDMGAGTQKSWTFSGSSGNTAGLVTGYQEIETTGAVLLQKTYSWGQSSSSNPYVASLTSTLNPGQSYAASTTTNQTVDAYGNLTQQQVSDYPNSTTGGRTYNMTYPTQSNQGWQLLPYYIFNRMLTATVTAGGSPVTLSNTVYDATCGGFGMTTTSATNNHDPAYAASSGPMRGNPWWVSGLNGGDTVCTAYDSAGVPWYSVNASGQSVSIGTDSATNFSLPTSIQPNGNSGMQTTASYASSWAATSLMGPNGDQGTTTYDSYGRPSQTTTPDGAVTTYTYTYSANASTRTATLDGRWQTTTLDGFGRTIQVQKGSGSTVVSTVQTQYAPCACSALGKVSAVSQPYGPGATVYWTTYTYDGSGRTLTVTAPDGASTTSYTYQGNSTTVTDPAGKWKTSTVDAYGNLILMTEPNPAGGTFGTTYTYTPVNQLTIVSTVRGNVTETRTYLYNGSDLVQATNPENGTVTYTYDLSHHVLTRTDALGQQTQYTYDSYGRLSEVQYYPTRSPYDGTLEDTIERVNYSYDAGQYGIGRLTSVTFDGGVKDSLYNAHYYTYAYTYNQAGRVTNQTVTLQAATGNNFNNLPPVNPPIATFTVGYQWDDEGRMTAMQSPTVTPSSYSSWPYPTVMPTMGYQYDINGRTTEMTSNGSTFATATYYPAGQLYQLSYGGMTETRTYNTMMQLITQSVPGYLNMTYNYSTTGHNNGRIISSDDGITGENTAYTYDALNRLTAASNSLWNQTYTYDGFGNLLTKSQANGSPNPSPATSVSYNANNQQTSGVGYDANGNTNSANWYSYGYTVENKMNSQTYNYWPYGVSLYAYDPWGKRVMKETNPDPNNYEGEDNPAWEFYFYSITGQRLVTMDCNNPNGNPIPSCWVVGESLYFKSKMLVSNGVYVVTDRLGSVRANTQGGTFAYYPYGEERTTNPNGLDKFATYFRDAAGQDYADQRYYNAGNGRFWSADPTAGSTANPASLNRYAYVRGDPVNLSDPTGRDPICGPGGVWMGEGCYNTGTGAPEDCWEEFGAEGCEDETGGGGGGSGGGGGGGGGCGSSMGSGFMETPDPNPTDCTDNTPPPSTPSCGGTQAQQTFVQTNFLAAAATANSMGIGGEDGDADILTLSGMESGWGSFTGGYQGAYFGMQAAVTAKYYAGETDCGAIYATINGKRRPTRFCEMEFSSFAAAAAVFASNKAGVVNGASDPITFFSNLYSGGGFAQGYKSDITYLQAMLPTWQWVDNCLHTLGLVQ